MGALRLIFVRIIIQVIIEKNDTWARTHLMSKKDG